MFIVYLYDGETYTFTTRSSLENWLNDPNRKEHYVRIEKE